MLLLALPWLTCTHEQSVPNWRVQIHACILRLVQHLQRNNSQHMHAHMQQYSTACQCLEVSVPRTLRLSSPAAALLGSSPALLKRSTHTCMRHATCRDSTIHPSTPPLPRTHLEGPLQDHELLSQVTAAVPDSLGTRGN